MRTIYDDINQAGSSNTEYAREFFKNSGAEFVAPADKYSAWDAMLVSGRYIALVEVKLRQLSLSKVEEYGGTLFLQREKYDRLCEERDRLAGLNYVVRLWYLNLLASGEAFLFDVSNMQDSSWVTKSMNRATYSRDYSQYKVDKRVALLSLDGALLVKKMTR